MIQENERNVNLRTKRYNKVMRWFLFGGFLLLLIFFASARNNLDPDFGWHLRMGELILKNGIPQTDPFTYTMPSYRFIDHEWLVDIFFAKAYPVIGVDGITLVFILLSCIAVCLPLLISKKKWSFVPFILSGLCLVPYLGIRPQVISWICFSGLLVLFFNQTYWKRFRWSMPLLFLFWANVHGGFVLGILILFLFLTTKMIADRKVHLQDCILFVLSILATLLTPYHVDMWREVWISVSDNSLRFAIQEWLPALFTFNLGFIFLMPFSVSLVLLYRARFSLSEKVLFGTLLFFALSSSRHIPFFALLSLPIMAKGFAFFYDSLQKDTISKKRFALVYRIMSGGVIGLLCICIGVIFFAQHASAVPKGAVEYLKHHPSKGNLFAEYDWGGYLIWKYPEKKVFVDGRMPSWHAASVPSGESNNAFMEYQ
jgi:hypothetical protein